VQTPSSQRKLQPTNVLQIIYRSANRCWDGKNLDSPDHKSHVAYPAGGNFQADNQGKCPTSHPIKIPQVFYETVWDTRDFNDKSTWPVDGSQPFVFSNGDPCVSLFYRFSEINNSPVALDTDNTLITYSAGKATLCKGLLTPTAGFLVVFSRLKRILWLTGVPRSRKLPRTSTAVSY
jgi:hypothetical protein